jgi:hypothetical protein
MSTLKKLNQTTQELRAQGADGLAAAIERAVGPTPERGIQWRMQQLMGTAARLLEHWFIYDDETRLRALLTDLRNQCNDALGDGSPTEIQAQRDELLECLQYVVRNVSFQGILTGDQVTWIAAAIARAERRAK